MGAEINVLVFMSCDYGTSAELLTMECLCVCVLVWCVCERYSVAFTHACVLLGSGSVVYLEGVSRCRRAENVTLLG